jgi:hypothetical protein
MADNNIWTFSTKDKIIEKTEPTLYFDVVISPQGVPGTIFTAISQLLYITLVMRLRCQIIDNVAWSDNDITLVGSQLTSYVELVINFQMYHLKRLNRRVSFMTVLFACLYERRHDFVSPDGAWLVLQMCTVQLSISITRALEKIFKTTLYFEVIENSRFKDIRFERVSTLNDNLPFFHRSFPFDYDAPIVSGKEFCSIPFSYNCDWGEQTK